MSSFAEAIFPSHNKLGVIFREAILQRPLSNLGAESDASSSMGVRMEIPNTTPDISLAIASEVNILISGGDAAARTALACHIHQSHGSTGSFIVLSARAEPDPSGAQAMIRASNGGTLFIEELADLDTDTVHELLRFVDRPGAEGAAPRRVIAAMGDDLQDRIASDPILGNLFYRLNSIHLVVQPRVSRVRTWLM